MGLYDIIDEITERQVTKTETGDNRIWGVMVSMLLLRESFESLSIVIMMFPRLLHKQSSIVMKLKNLYLLARKWATSLSQNL